MLVFTASIILFRKKKNFSADLKKNNKVYNLD